jgi:hypothetical protein
MADLGSEQGMRTLAIRRPRADTAQNHYAFPLSISYLPCGRDIRTAATELLPLSSPALVWAADASRTQALNPSFDRP